MTTKSYTAKEIEAKYNIGSSTLNRWVNTLKDLGLTIGSKVNRKPIYSEEDIKQFNSLKAHLDGGGKTKDYLLPSPTEPINETPWDSQTINTEAIEPTIPPVPVQSHELSATELALVEVVHRLTEPSPVDKLEVIKKKYEILEFLCENKIEIPTREVTELIGKRPKGNGIIFGSYHITYVGNAGNSKMWNIQKKS